MYMPLMVDVRRAVVFGGERGEGLQKTQKLALYADELLVVPERPVEASEMTFPAGRLSEVNENLSLAAPRTVPIHPVEASRADLDQVIRGATFVTSDLEDRALNEAIVEVAHRHHVLCNIIDTKDLCNTWFMSLVESPHLMGGWSTKATATFYVTRLRRELERRIPRWEREAEFTARLREALPPSRRRDVLAKAWKSATVRFLLFWLGVDAALDYSLNHWPQEASA